MVPGVAMSQRLYSNASGKTKISNVESSNHSLRAVVFLFFSYLVASISRPWSKALPASVDV